VVLEQNKDVIDGNDYAWGKGKKKENGLEVGTTLLMPHRQDVEAVRQALTLRDVCKKSVSQIVGMLQATPLAKDGRAQCDRCEKWRPVNAEQNALYAQEGVAFECAFIGRSCDDAVDLDDSSSEPVVAAPADSAAAVLPNLGAGARDSPIVVETAPTADGSMGGERGGARADDSTTAGFAGPATAIEARSDGQVTATAEKKRTAKKTAVDDDASTKRKRAVPSDTPQLTTPIGASPRRGSKEEPTPYHKFKLDPTMRQPRVGSARPASRDVPHSVYVVDKRDPSVRSVAAPRQTRTMLVTLRRGQWVAGNGKKAVLKMFTPTNDCGDEDWSDDAVSRTNKYAERENNSLSVVSGKPNVVRQYFFCKGAPPFAALARTSLARHCLFRHMHACRVALKQQCLVVDTSPPSRLLTSSLFAADARAKKPAVIGMEDLGDITMATKLSGPNAVVQPYDAVRWMKDVLSGLTACHVLNIMHNDLKVHAPCRTGASTPRALLV
jgi:hypothetical protein